MWRYESIDNCLMGNEFSYSVDEPMNDDCWGFDSFDSIKCEDYYLDDESEGVE